MIKLMVLLMMESAPVEMRDYTTLTQCMAAGAQWAASVRLWAARSGLDADAIGYSFSCRGPGPEATHIYLSPGLSKMYGSPVLARAGGSVPP